MHSIRIDKYGMGIETNFNIGDQVIYDDNKIGTVVGIEIIVGLDNRKTESYNIKGKNIHDQVVLDNKGSLREENELRRII